jgi:hypothetical protein
MRILLYNPDNGVTRNFMPHLWMFLLQALTPAGHEVLLIDGNAQPMNEEGITRFVREENIGLVGIRCRSFRSWLISLVVLCAKTHIEANNRKLRLRRLRRMVLVS